LAGRVPVTITGGPATLEVKILPKHKKNAAIGEKTTVYTSSIFVEQEDAVSFDDQEEVSCIVISTSTSVNVDVFV
jgi:glutamyl-tRNA synthetase